MAATNLQELLLLGTITFYLIIALLILSYITVGLRLWVRYRITKTPGWDDAAMVATLVSIERSLVWHGMEILTGSCVVTLYMLLLLYLCHNIPQPAEKAFHQRCHPRHSYLRTAQRNILHSYNHPTQSLARPILPPRPN